MDNKAILTIGRMARRRTLEVEHLLKAARTPSAALADCLEGLAAELGWHMHDSFPAVPFGRWVAVISCLCRQGHPGLAAMVRDPDSLPFVFGLLADLRSADALAAIIDIIRTNRDWLLAAPQRAMAAAAAYNGAAMHLRPGLPDVQEQAPVRDFLHAALAATGDEAAIATLLCALRFAGDAGSLPVIAACPPLSPQWEPARAAAINAIRKAMRQRAG